MRKVLVAKDLNYAASKTSTSADTALNPVDLREGAIGIYGIAKTSANNGGKLALIIDGGSDAAGKVPDSAFDGEAVMICVGTANGYRNSALISLPAAGGQVTWEPQEYAAATAQVVHLGYDGSVATKSLNMPATSAIGGIVHFSIIDSENVDLAGAFKPERQHYEVTTTVANTTNYAAASALQVKLNANANKWMSSKIISNGTGSAIANTATVAGVNGATSLTTSAAHGVGVADYVALDGELYQAVTGTTGSTLVLDRPFNGATGTVANANALDLGATIPTAIGLQLTSLVRGRNFTVAVSELLVDASITYSTAGTSGSGVAEDVMEMEKEVAGYLGSTSGATETIMPYPAVQAVAGTAYDIYVFRHKNPMQRATGGTAQKAHSLYGELVVAIPDAGSNGGQAEFEDVMGVLLKASDGIGGLDAS